MHTRVQAMFLAAFAIAYAMCLASLASADWDYGAAGDMGGDICDMDDSASDAALER